MFKIFTKLSVLATLMAALLFVSGSNAFAATGERLMVRIDGIFCTSCTGPLIRKLKKLGTIEHVAINMKSGILTITPNGKGSLTPDSVIGVINSSAYKYRGMTVEGRGNVSKSGSDYYFNPAGSTASYRLTGSSGNLDKAANGGQVFISGSLQGDNRTIQVRSVR